MAVTKSSLNIIEVVRVRPSSGSAHSLALPLTFFDLAWLKLHPVERVFFYRLTEPNESTRPYFDSVILPKLKTSLSTTLLTFLPLAGRLVWDAREPKPYVLYSQNDAVSLTVAESESDFSHLSSSRATRVATDLHPLVPDFPCSNDATPVISLQATFFPSQGFCIGISAHHAVLDGKTTSMFVRAWAHICKQGASDSLPQDLTPFLDRTVIKDPTGLGMKILNCWSSDKSKSLKLLPAMEVSSDVVRVTFELTRDDIKKLRDRVKNESSHRESPKELHLSTFVIAYAYILTCMVKARGGDSSRRVCYGFTADFRSRLDPPVPSTYFGNCVVGAGDFNSKAGAFLEEKKGFISTVGLVSDLVKGLGPEVVEKNTMEPFEAFKHVGPGTQMVSVAGSTRLGLYGSDFGWGRPVKVEIVSIDKDMAVSLSERREESGGVEIGVCLKKHEMQIFASIFSQALN